MVVIIIIIIIISSSSIIASIVNHYLYSTYFQASIYVIYIEFIRQICCLFFVLRGPQDSQGDKITPSDATQQFAICSIPSSARWKNKHVLDRWSNQNVISILPPTVKWKIDLSKTPKLLSFTKGSFSTEPEPCWTMTMEIWWVPSCCLWSLPSTSNELS